MIKITKRLLGLLLLTSATVFQAQATDISGIAASAEQVSPKLPGQTFANACLQNLEKKQVCTEQLFAEKPTVLVFYRGGWCPYCNAQLSRLQKIENQLIDLGYQVLAVSPDSNKNISKQKKREKLNYTLLTDDDLALSKEAGVAFLLNNKTSNMLNKKLGVATMDVNGESRIALPAPAVYIIDKKGKVHFQYVNPNYSVRLDEKILLVAAEQSLKAMK